MTALTPYVSRNGAGTFSTALNFMEEYSGYTVSIPLQDRSPQSGRTQSGSNLYKSTKWTDPPRVKLIQVHKVDEPQQGSKPVHKVDGPTKGQTYPSPQSERTLPRVKTRPQSGRTPLRVKTSQQSERTRPGS